MHQRSANGGKRQHEAKGGNHQILRVMMRDPTRSSTPPQSTANASLSAC